MPRLEQVFDFYEQTSGQLQGTLTRNDGETPIGSNDLATLTLTLYALKSDATIAYVNSRNGQNVLNQNNVTLDASGLLTWTVQPEDTTLVEDLDFERHYALFEWTWVGGTGRALVVLVVQNLVTVS